MKNFCEWLEKKDQKYFRTLIFKEQGDPSAFDINNYQKVKLSDGEEYYEEHEKELSKEYKEIMDIVVAREMMGENKIIHGINEKEK